MSEYPTDLFMQAISGYRMSIMLRLAAQLNVVDHLRDGTKTFEELSQLTDSNPDALYRFLRALAGLGLIAENPGPGQFELTPTGVFLQADHPLKLRDTILFHCGEVHWKAWDQLSHSVKTGETAFKHVYEMSFFDYAETDAELNQVFNNAMLSNSSRMVASVLATYDFSPFKCMIDVGGGNGALLAAILSKNPDSRGILFDLPHVVESAPAVLDGAGVRERCEIVGGSFFEKVPPDGDLYILKLVLHDWKDECSLGILKKCRAAMKPEAKLLIIDLIMPERIETKLPPGIATWIDLEMLVMLDGRERKQSEFSSLLTQAGLHLNRVIPLPGAAFCILEGIIA